MPFRIQLIMFLILKQKAQKVLSYLRFELNLKEKESTSINFIVEYLMNSKRKQRYQKRFEIKFQLIFNYSREL